MSAQMKLTIVWCLTGIVVGVALGVIGYFSGYEYFKEPPPYCMLVLSVFFSVSGAVRAAFAAGAQERSKGGTA